MSIFLTIGIILLVLWALGFSLFPAIGGLIHILLVVAVIAIIWHLVTGKKIT